MLVVSVLNCGTLLQRGVRVSHEREVRFSHERGVRVSHQGWCYDILSV